jgi:hypothetical protein
MRVRECEIYESLRRDDLSSIMSSRYEGLLSSLPKSDLPDMFRGQVTTLMVAAYFGSYRCFRFLIKHVKSDLTTKHVYFFINWEFIFC